MPIGLITAQGVSFTWQMWIFLNTEPTVYRGFFPAGLAHQISATVDVLVGLDLILQCLPQAGSSSPAREVKVV